MRTSIRTVFGGVLLLGLASACGNSKGGDDNSQPGSAGDGNAGDSDPGSESAGTAGLGEAGAGGSSTAGTSGLGGDAGALDPGTGGDSGDNGMGGTAGVLGTGGVAGGAGLGGTAGAGGSIDIGAQKTSDKLDVLFVIDNSVSMADKQNILKSSMPSFVNRLVNPLCVDAQGKPTAVQPASGALACVSGTRELKPVTNLHLGVITTSLGAHGGTTGVCTTGQVGDTLDDKAELITTHRDNIASYLGSGYLSFDSAGQVGVSNVTSLITDLQAMISAAGEHGCGYEAPLEAMYRFLVDPEPPLTVELVNGSSVRTGVNSTLLTQRAAFLRPDSSVAVVILSDESDCSIVDEGAGWFIGSSGRMPLATSACDGNPNDKCCRSCATNESSPPAGCGAISEDSLCKTVPTGQLYATWDALHDSLNLRCFDQRRRFGFDLLYPIERYSDALTNPVVKNRAQEWVPNPLLAARDGKGPRSATLISVSLIVGAPWQDLATTSSLSVGHELQYLDGTGLSNSQRWPLLIGDRVAGTPATDPFMRESVAARSGQNPLTNAAIVAATSMSPTANAINGHEQNLADLADLQYACTFPLAAPKICASGDSACDCSPDKNGSTDAVITTNSPLCQPPAGGVAGSTQYYGKGYPGARELSFAQLLGARAVPASICPKTLTDLNSPDYAYRPAFSALIGRLAATLD
ncbi:MAG: hypothetical protein ABIQ16_16495 [Polyangiaceae bacterium]